jgi:hypothetical protein
MLRSLRDHIDNAVSGRITGKSAASARSLFTTIDHSTPSYIRNPGCWLADIDTTCLSVWNSRGSLGHYPTAITSRVAIGARHAPLSVGDTVRWVTRGNQVITRTVEATDETIRWSSNPVVDPTDHQLCLLDEALPATITPAPLLPANHLLWTGDKPYGMYDEGESDPGVPIPPPLTAIQWAGYGYPAVIASRTSVASIAFLTGIDSGSFEGSSLRNTKLDLDPSDRIHWDYDDWYTAAVSGDSGRPIMLLIDRQLVILGTFFSAFAGPSLVGNRGILREAMRTLTSDPTHDGTDVNLGWCPRL